MSGFLSKLFGGGSKTSAAPAGEREVYNGFEIEPRPKAGGGSYNVAGVIRREGEPDGPAHEFIRADTFPNVEEAIRFSVIKAKQIIDQKGDKMFNDGGGW
jgi:hypothetical protein